MEAGGEAGANVPKRTPVISVHDRYHDHVAPKQSRRLGRPPASSSAETRLRILDVAQQSFAELGYGVTTNKYLATQAGITTGALYHYFDSKVEIYQAVYDQVQEYMFLCFDESLAGLESFIERFEAVLEVAHRLNTEDPSLARFIGAVRIDVARHEELRKALGNRSGRTQTFFRDLVDHGVATGEIKAADRDMVRAFVRITVVGLTDGASGDSQGHRLAVDAIRAVIEGRLVSPGRPAREASPKKSPEAMVESTAHAPGRTTAGLPSDQTRTNVRRAIRHPAAVRTKSSS